MRILLTLCTVLLTTGCTALMVGGAAAGGYQLGKDERSAAQVTRDGATTAAIKSRLIADSEVSAFNVNVDTYANRVTLRGTVGVYQARARAGEIAAAVEAVQSVDNQLKVVIE
jgi:hyperosmotically inducible periplasmic protein